MRQQALFYGLWCVFAVACSLFLLSLYGNSFDIVLSGVRIKSTSMLSLALVATASWMGLGFMDRQLRPSRDILLILVCFGVYSYTYHLPYSRDVYPTEYTALAISTGNGTSLDGYPELVEQGVPYFITETPQGLRSSYPLGPALLAWPLYLPAPLSDTPRPELVHRLGVSAAILIGLASVWLVLQIAHRLDPPFSPYLLAFAYALGTTHWSTSASAMFQHGPGELWVLGALERLLDEQVSLRRRLLALGACMTLAVFTRPSLIISAVLVALLALWRYKKDSVVALVGAVPLALPLLAYHFHTYGSVLGAYVSQKGDLTVQPFGDWLERVFWLMASPSRGVLWYEPVVVLTLVVALVRLPRVKGATLAVGLLGFAMFTALYAHWSTWWGGYSFGPRLLTDALPWWILAIASMGRVGPWFRNVTVVLTLFGIAVNTIGTLEESPVIWDAHPSVNRFPDRLKSIEDSQLLLGFLMAGAGGDVTRDAVRADNSRKTEKALELWQEEWEKRRWNRFAAFRIADLLVETDRLDEALEHIDMLSDLWPESGYVRHLEQQMTSVIRLLDRARWVRPTSARASRNSPAAAMVFDSLLSTRWSTKLKQRAGDWLELEFIPASVIQGVVLVSAPEFGHAPFRLEAIGMTPEDRYISLGKKRFRRRLKGWHVISFDPVELSRVRITLTSTNARPWTVTEARAILAGNR